MALGLTSFGYGAIVGVLIQVALALEITILPGDTVGAHASAMTFGYLVLTAMGFIEWRLLGTRGIPTLGAVQVGALFLGGIIISVALLAGAEQIGGMLYLLAELVAVVLFVIRIWPAALRSGWLDASPRRHFGVASIWAVARAPAVHVHRVHVHHRREPRRPGGLPAQRPDRQRPRRVPRRHHERRARACCRSSSCAAARRRGWRTSSSGA